MNLNEGVWYQSACSGLWYEVPGAAGTIAEVRVNGEQFLPLAKFVPVEEQPALTMDEIKTLAIKNALCKHKRNVEKAAEELGITGRTVYNWIHKMRKSQ